MPDKAFSIKHRHAARRCAVQAIYQWQLAGHDYETIAAQFMEQRAGESIDWAYFERVLNGVMHAVEAIDQAIASVSQMTPEELTPVELAVLRLAVYELMHEKSVPYKVVINEALELTKRYGTQEGFKFVNGILDKLANTLAND